MWYTGNIPDAIAESRTKSRLFVVYITGDGDDSRKMDQYWTEDRVQKIMQATSITLKLTSESEGCKQFSAIYPVMVIPSAHFIDNQGQALAVLTSQSSFDDFVGKIEVVTKGFGESRAQITMQSATASDHQGQQKSKEEIENETQKLQEKIKNKREDDAEKKKEEEKRKEIERRELGKNLQKLKDAQKEAKLKQDLEERKRNKLEEKAAKERVKKQIEQDKIDRAAKYQQEKAERDQAAAAKQSEIDRKNEEKTRKERQERDSKARLQFRMPDGSSLVQQFESTDVLLSAFTFVVNQNLPRFSSIDTFNLAVSFPRKVYSSSDHEKTFLELGLSPSASLVVLPIQHKSAGGGSDSTDILSSIWSIVMFILYLPIQLLQFLWSFIAGQPSNQQSSTIPTAQGDSETSYGDVNPGLRRRQLGSGGSMESKRQGNMTRLSDVKRDDEDDATWNGNSTQQM